MAVFFGGTDGTHDLSTQTGQWFCQEVPRSSYQVTPVQIQPDGSWKVPQGPLPQRGDVQGLWQSMFSGLKKLSPTEGLGRLVTRPLTGLVNLIRGKGGDDGALHGLAETLGVPMAGSPLAACQVCSHKHLCYQTVDDLAATPFTLTFGPTEDPTTIVAEVRDLLTPPLYVKAATGEGGSAVERIVSLAELAAAVKRLQQAGQTVLVQEALTGPELHLTLLGDAAGRLTSLPATIITPRESSFYDERARRHPGRVQTRHQSETDSDVVAEAHDIAQQVWQRLGLKRYASFDFIASDNGVTLLEVNLIPNASHHAPLHNQLRAAGLSPASFIDGYLR